MDKLDTIFQMQKALNDNVLSHRAQQEYTSEEWMQKLTLAMMSELAELIDEVNFKWWKNPRPVQMGAVREELTDILHFFISMCLRAGMDAQMLFDTYCIKHEENIRRQEGKSTKPGYSVAEQTEES